MATTELRPVLVIEGRCVLCGCTDLAACVDGFGSACWWVDRKHTICSHHPQSEIKATVELVKGIRPRTYEQVVDDLVEVGFSKKRARELVDDPEQLDVELGLQADVIEELGLRSFAEQIRASIPKRKR